MVSPPLPTVPHPRHVNLESTLGCNLECVMCGSFRSGVTKQRATMSPELLERVRNQALPGTQDVSLTVAGEPFMTPRLPSFVELAESAGSQIQLNTNATLIRDTKLLRRLLRQASVIKFSVDGATPETYASIRNGGALPQVLDNIRMVVRVRSELPAAERPRLVMCMVLMRRNVEELVQMVDLAHGLGLDRLDVAHLTVLVPDMDAESLRHHPKLSDQHLRAARRRADQVGLRVSLPVPMDGAPTTPGMRAQAKLALDELRGLTRTRLRRAATTGRHHLALARWSAKARGRVPCHFLMGAAFITHGGDVAPCPMPGRPIVGNLLEQDFDAIWNGPVLTAMRQGFLAGTPFACCAHCSQNPHGYDPADAQTARPEGYDLALG